MTDRNPTFELIDKDDQAYADYAGRFGPYNIETAGLDPQTFSLVLRDKGRIVAGGRGHVYLGALEIRGLWVDDSLRGQGIGTKLMDGIEDEARRRGATKAMLYTYSWQAEDFYCALGYNRYARFDFPSGHYRVDMQKTL